MKVRSMSSPLPSFSKFTETTDAHYHRCRHCRHHCHYRCVRREDPEIDDLCTFNLFFLSHVHLHPVGCIYALFNLRPPPGTCAMMAQLVTRIRPSERLNNFKFVAQWRLRKVLSVSEPVSPLVQVRLTPDVDPLSHIIIS